MKRTLSALVVFVAITLGYLVTSTYSVNIGQNTVVTNHTKAEVLAKNFIGNVRGFGKDNLGGLSLYIIGDDYEIVAVKSVDGRMVGHTVSKYTAIALKKLVADGHGDLAYNIAKSDIGDRIIYPLRFITLDEIEPKDLGIIELPIPGERTNPTSTHPRLLSI